MLILLGVRISFPLILKGVLLPEMVWVPALSKLLTFSSFWPKPQFQGTRGLEQECFSYQRGAFFDSELLSFVQKTKIFYISIIFWLHICEFSIRITPFIYLINKYTLSTYYMSDAMLVYITKVRRSTFCLYSQNLRLWFYNHHHQFHHKFIRMGDLKNSHLVASGHLLPWA